MTVLRPPGHHAHRAGKDSKPSGFCFFNNVAVAANYLRKTLGYKKILVLDWDVHHGDGTQDIFKDTNEVLFISLHCFDNGLFYPEKSGDSAFIGQGEGEGFNINVAFDIFRTKRLLDEDYIYLFDTLLMPIIAEYGPEFILVSSGFDSCRGDPLADMMISPRSYYHMLQKLRTLQNKIVVCLEGGYNLDNVKDGTYSVISSLLDISEQDHIEAVKRINTKQRRTSLQVSMDNHFVEKTWQMSMLDSSKIVPQQFVIDLMNSLKDKLTGRWPGVDWKDIGSRIESKSKNRSAIDQITAGMKIPNVDCIGIYSMALSFSTVNRRRFSKAVDKLKGMKDSRWSFAYFDDEEVNVIVIDWPRQLTFDQSRLMAESGNTVKIGEFDVDVDILSTVKLIVSTVE